MNNSDWISLRVYLHCHLWSNSLGFFCLNRRQKQSLWNVKRCPKLESGKQASCSAGGLLFNCFHKNDFWCSIHGAHVFLGGEGVPVWRRQHLLEKAPSAEGMRCFPVEECFSVFFMTPVHVSPSERLPGSDGIPNLNTFSSDSESLNVGPWQKKRLHGIVRPMCWTVALCRNGKSKLKCVMLSPKTTDNIVFLLMDDFRLITSETRVSTISSMSIKAWAIKQHAWLRHWAFICKNRKRSNVTSLCVFRCFCEGHTEIDASSQKARPKRAWPFSASEIVERWHLIFVSVHGMATKFTVAASVFSLWSPRCEFQWIIFTTSERKWDSPPERLVPENFLFPHRPSAPPISFWTNVRAKETFLFSEK